MERHATACLLALLWLLPMTNQAQNPAILHFGGTALPSGMHPDTAFCKGQPSVHVHGTSFVSAPGGSWLSTTATLGGIPCLLLSVSDSLLEVAIPDSFPRDTCLALEVARLTILAPDTFRHIATDTVCLTGDRATVEYGSGIFCLGDPNPVPAVTLSPSTATGTFCCRTGTPGLWVNPATGEVPIHPGAVGSASFLFATSHPYCPDNVPLTVEVRARQQAIATVNGSASATVCQSGPDITPDAPGPPGGVFRSWTGLAVIDSLTGLFSPAQSAAGQHSLWYIPLSPCHDSVMITVNVLAPATASVGYPSIPVDTASGYPTLCQGSSLEWPVFTSGSSGGMFLCQPVGLAMTAAGGIDPSASLPGVYAVAYVPSGACPQLAAALPYLAIVPATSAQFTLSQAQLCAWDSLRPAATSPGTWEVLDGAGTLRLSSPSTPVPLNSLVPGAYTLRHCTMGFCADTATALFSVIPSDDASFTYPSPSYCMGGGDPWPVIAGTGGGTFSAATTYTVVDPDGRLRLQGSGAGSHTVRHRTGGTCPDSAAFTVAVFAQASALFSYPSSQYCTADSNPLPSATGTPGGVFTADSGLAVDPATGEIALAQSQPGAWDVTYTLNGSCQATYTLTLEIGQTDTSTAFAYPSIPLCPGGGNLFPFIAGDTVGSFIAGAGAFLVSPATGQLDLDRMQPGGPYTVHYDVASRCATDLETQVWVEDLDDPAFTYPQGQWCQGGADPLPDLVALSGGTFAEPTGGIVFASSTTGRIDASQSLAGTYIVSYTTAGPCHQSSGLPLTILAKPDDPGLQANPSATVCERQTVAVTANVGGADSLLWTVNGIPSPEDGPMLMLEGGGAGTDTAALILVTAQGCADTAYIHISRTPSPHLTASLSGRHTDATGKTMLRYAIASDLDGTTVRWRAEGAADLEPQAGMLPLPLSRETGSVTLTAKPNDAYGLAIVTLTLIAEAGGCPGQPLTLTDTLGPDAKKVFVPEVITPNGDGKNDTWALTCLGDADPEAYTMRLFNDGGAKVLEMQGLHQGFDGNTLPDGVYWWVLETGGREVQYGGLTIRRK